MIMMMQNGGPGQMDLFDPKPELTKFTGKVHTEKVEMFQPGSEGNTLLGSPLKFCKYGSSGIEMSEILPHLGIVVDDICMVRSMYNYHNNHTESLVALNTGKIFQGRPALGSWISYGLGSENQNLPAYIVLRDPRGYNTSGTLLWQNGWMPAIYRGTEISTSGTPVLNLNPSKPIPPQVQQDNLNFLEKLNRKHLQRFPYESALEARIQNYELAARMQLVYIPQYCRLLILQENPHHLLLRLATFDEALQDESFVHLLKQLQRRYPQERAEQLLSQLAIELPSDEPERLTDEHYAAELLGVSLAEIQRALAGRED